MTTSVVLHLLLLLTTLTTIQQGCFADDALCKFDSFPGPPLPNIVSLIKGQSAFSGLVEILSPSSGTIQVQDSYNEADRSGSIIFEDQVPIKSIHYYRKTGELFTINNGSTGCKTLPLETSQESQVLYQWMPSEGHKMLGDLKPHIDQLDILGPSVLMVLAALLPTVYYQKAETLDGFAVNRWSACVSPSDTDLAMDIYFLANTNLPYQLTIYNQQASSVKILFNLLTFNPIVSPLYEPLAVPLGAGCKRLDEPKVVRPVWASSDTYYLEMEAAISFAKPDRLSLSAVKAIKYQNMYAYEITESSANVTRTIKSPSLINYYRVDPITGYCSIEYRDFFTLYSNDMTIQWPATMDSTIKYNLLASSLYNLDYTSYLGQIRTDYGVMDVFEGLLTSFFTTSQRQNVAALVQYRFPLVTTTDYHRNQPPHHIIIKPFDFPANNQEYLKSIVPSQITLTVVDYLESEINYDDYFDVSGCFNEPGQYTWFQLVFPDTTLDIARYQERDLTIYKSFESMASNLIPKLRLPEVRVNIFGPNIYITCKLLEASKYNLLSTPSSVLSNPTRIVIREYLEDCSQLCLDADYCPAFAHCSNMQCYLYTPQDSAFKTEYSNNCTLYLAYQSDSIDLTSSLESNLFKSSKHILHQLQVKMAQGALILPDLKLSAGDLFIVDGPDQIGGVDQEFNDQSSSSSLFASGDDFTVIKPNQRFNSEPSRTLGVSYQTCLTLCSNDDDCLTLSYCPAPLSECIMTNKTAQDVQKSYQYLASYVDDCHILSKSFLSFYHKLPGRSLVLDAISQMKNVDPSECAQICSQSTDFDCQSFDYCPKIKNTQDQKTESACFLHRLHVATDTAHELTEKVWDFGNSECDHYSRKYSKDYQHLLGNKFKDGLHFIETLNDNSLEYCASQCNDNPNGCVAFEYCELPSNTVAGPISTCRLTDYRSPESANYLVEYSSTSELCSVYVNLKSSKSSKGYLNGSQDEGQLGMAMAMEASFFIAALAIGVVASHFYIKKLS